jgi:hypothetical protein
MEKRVNLWDVWRDTHATHPTNPAYPKFMLTISPRAIFIFLKVVITTQGRRSEQVWIARMEVSADVASQIEL